MLPDGEDRRDERTNDANTGNRSDDNIDERIQKFQNQFQNVYWYRIPLKYICDLGLVNTPIKFNTKWCLTFEINKSKSYSKVKRIRQSMDFQTRSMQKLLSTRCYIFLTINSTWMMFIERISNWQWYLKIC